MYQGQEGLVGDVIGGESVKLAQLFRPDQPVMIRIPLPGADVNYPLGLCQPVLLSTQRPFQRSLLGDVLNGAYQSQRIAPARTLDLHTAQVMQRTVLGVASEIQLQDVRI